jgi:ribosomal-protein-alanine N-acetyltransferase
VIVSVGAEAADLLAALHASAFDRPWSASELSAMLANANTFALVATDEAPLGFAMAWVVADEAELLTVAVAKDARRQGVGRSLLAAVMDAARARGARRLHLEVAEDNTPALALYRGLGFEQTATRRGYYQRAGGAPADALVMNMRLA